MPDYILTINCYASTSEGTCTPATPATYPSGTVVSVQAYPEAGYVFDYFTGNLSGKTNPQNITMNANKTVNAYFALEQTASDTLDFANVPTIAGTVVADLSAFQDVLNFANVPTISGTVVADLSALQEILGSNNVPSILGSFVARDNFPVGSCFIYDASPAGWTDKTTEVNEGTINDVRCFPAAPAINDALYFGQSYKTSFILFNIGTIGVGTYTLVWEYWNGAWTTITTETPASNDDIFNLKALGLTRVTYIAPSDWVLYSLNGSSKFWIRLRISSFTSMSVIPLLTQAWFDTDAAAKYSGRGFGRGIMRGVLD